MQRTRINSEYSLTEEIPFRAPSGAMLGSFPFKYILMRFIYDNGEHGHSKLCRR